MISDSFYPTNLAHVDPKLFIPELLNFGNSYFIEANFNLADCMTQFEDCKKFEVTSGGTLLKFKFPANAELHMSFSFTNSNVNIAYSFIMNNDFLKGYHQLQANGGGDEFIEKAVLNLVNRIMNGDFKTEKQIKAEKPVIEINDEDNKVITADQSKSDYHMPAKKFFKSGSGGDQYFVSVEERRVSYGYQNYGSATMSASSGGSSTSSFKDVLEGDIDNWVLSVFSEGVLSAIKSEVNHRIRFKETGNW